MTLGISAAAARRQASQELSVYDCIIVDDRGWICVEGLDLSAQKPTKKAVSGGVRRRAQAPVKDRERAEK